MSYCELGVGGWVGGSDGLEEGLGRVVHVHPKVRGNTLFGWVGGWVGGYVWWKREGMHVKPNHPLGHQLYGRRV